jgi:hypothetical protein
MYNSELARTFQQDPMSNLFYNMSPYSWSANNSISFIDPTGMVIESGSQKEWDKQKKLVEKRRDNLQKTIDKLNTKAAAKGWSQSKLSNRVGDKADRVTSLNGSLKTLKDLEGSTQIYKLSRTSNGQDGGTTLDSNTKVIDISFGSTGNFIHETTHAGQFETGDMAFDSSTGNSVAQDINDEIASYKAQFAYDPSSVSNLSSTAGVANSFASITSQWVQGLSGGSLYVPIGHPNFIPGQSANTGVSPLNINSTKSDFIKAFPNSSQIKSFPANFVLKTSHTSIYYKQ